MTKESIKIDELLKFILSITIALVIFLWALDLMTDIFQYVGNQTINKLLEFTSNPFISLFIGLFITAVIQSSSTSTSLIVAMVASGSLPLENAIPMIMGANIGTTLTSTVVSLSYITNRYEFRNALTSGVMHDFFNIFTVAILFPLEYYYHVLSRLSGWAATIFDNNNTYEGGQGTKYELFGTINESLISSFEYKSILFIIAAGCLLGSIKFLSKIISNKMILATKTRFQEVFFKNSLNSFGLGTMLTAVSQSSSITTTVIVPLAAVGKVPAKKIFPYIIGANVGTTITAIIAAINRSETAMSIALVHFFFNGIGACLWLIPIFRKLPVLYARKFSAMTADYKIVGFFYILFVFFVFPLALIFIYKLLNS
ncbi:Na/Pi symporter [Reichenbachiella versicolor]|uniref:Na/Pi symporter n=1 Tax=Reichenbachiella versicolor TaxID=1821036 RepID=UPI000D6DD866|nr:Na/Pi symporter [Reichenbachiella versicolor]